MNQKTKVLNALSKGTEITAKQLASRFKIASPTKVISLLRQEGYSIQLKQGVDSKGRTNSKYFLKAKTSTKRSAAHA